MEQMDITKMDSSELGLLLGQQYQMVMQANNNIIAISNELKSRNNRPKQIEEVKDGKRD